MSDYDNLRISEKSFPKNAVFGQKCHFSSKNDISAPFFVIPGLTGNLFRPYLCNFKENEFSTRSLNEITTIS